MTGLFDGMAELLADVFGGPVLHRPQAGVPAEIDSVFRTEPTEIEDDPGGAILISVPTWRVPITRADNISNGDLIEPGNGETYKVLNRISTASPAMDRFLIFELELVA